jgi:hypothetical protein
MSEALGTTLVFIVVFIVVPWGSILVLRMIGRRRGAGGSLYAPPSEEPPADRPLRCRLNLFHRWRTMRTPTGDRYQRCADCGKTRDIPMVGPPP